MPPDATRGGGATDAGEASASVPPPAPHPLWGRRTVLVMDSTSEELSLALLLRGQPAGAVYAPLGRRITGAILPRLDALLRAAGVTVRDVEMLVAGRGPGSFTGTRIALGVAHTFAMVAGVPLLGVDALQVLAWLAEPPPPELAGPLRAGQEPPVLHALLNCVRDEVYHAEYVWQEAPWGGLLPVRRGEITLADMLGLRARIGDAPVVLRRFPGNRGQIRSHEEGPFAGLRHATRRRAQPDGWALLAAALEQQASPGAVMPATPIYLKSEAFRKWKGATEQAQNAAGERAE